MASFFDTEARTSGVKSGWCASSTGARAESPRAPARAAATADNRKWGRFLHVIARLRPRLAQVPGMRTYLQNPPPIRIGGQLTKSQYQFTLQSPSLDDLYRSASQLEERLRVLPELEAVNSDLQIRTPQVMVNIDRDKASILGISADQVENALNDAYGARWISTIYAPNDQYRVLLELEP